MRKIKSFMTILILAGIFLAARSSYAHSDVDELIAELSSPNAKERVTAANEIAELGKEAKKAVPTLIKMLDDRTAVDMREPKEETHEDEEEEPHCCQSGEEDFSSPAVEAIKALGAIGAKEVIAPLKSRLEDKDTLVRKYAAASLGKAGWKPSDQNEEVKYLFAQRKWNDLSRIGKPAAGYLITMLNDKMFQARIEAYYILEEKCPDWRESEVTKETVPRFISDLKDKDAELRVASAEALKEAKDIRAKEPLIAALSDEYYLVRKTAAAALEKLGWEPDSVSDEIAYSIADMNTKRLREIGAPAIEPLIKTLYAINNWITLEECLATLDKLDKEWRKRESVKGLVDHHIDKIRTSNDYIGDLSADALGTIRDPAAILPLIEMLKDKALTIKKRVAVSLKKLTKKKFGTDHTKWLDWYKKTYAF